jgi:hypothetical protein
MKRIAIALVLASLSIAHAADLPLAEQVVEASGLKTSLENSFVQSMEAATQQLKATGGEELAKAAMDVVRKFFTENIKWEDMRPVYGKAYAEQFSDAELKDLLAFYQSPVGKKLADKNTVLSSQASKTMSEKMKNQMPALQAEVMKVVREHMEKKQGGSK